VSTTVPPLHRGHELGLLALTDGVYRRRSPGDRCTHFRTHPVSLTG
jgi:hypothetical protein